MQTMTMNEDLIINNGLHFTNNRYDEMVFNKVYRKVEQSYTDEINQLKSTRGDLQTEEERLVKQKEQELHRLQRERWMRFGGSPSPVPRFLFSLFYYLIIDFEYILLFLLIIIIVFPVRLDQRKVGPLWETCTKTILTV